MDRFPIFALVSPTRSEETVKKYLSAFDFSHEVYVIKKRDEVNNYKEILQNAQSIIIIFLSGGTSSIAVKMLDYINRERTTAIFVTISENNSLPSGIKAKEIFRTAEVKVYLYHLRGENEQKAFSQMYYKAIEIIEKFRNSRILLAGVDESFFDLYRISVKELERRYGTKVITVSLDELIQTFEQSKANKKVIDVFGKNSTFDVEKASKVRTAIEKLMNKYNATDFGIRCFPFLIKTKVTPCLALSSLIDDGIVAGCEADIQAIVTMKIFMCLNHIPFIGNVVDVSGNEISLAHCTVATKLVKKIELINHFESGYDVAIKGTFETEIPVTLAIISKDFKKIVIGEGIISDHEWMPFVCRTQVKISLKNAKDDLLNKLIAGHLVLTIGHIKKVIIFLARLLGLDIVDLNG